MVTNEQILAKLEQIEQILKTQAEKKENVLTIPEAAQYLNISQSYLYKLTSLAAIPHFKPGGKKVFFDKSDLDNWIRRNRVSSAQQPET